MTLRRLVVMAKGRDKQLWNHTCAVVVTLINVWSETKVSVEEVHPYCERPAPNIERLSRKESMAYLKGIYGKPNGR